MRPGQPAKPGARPLPREHGAWGILLQPFIATAILARDWNFALIPAFCYVFAGFLLREPLLVLFRLRKHKASQGYAQPLRWLAAEGAIALLSLAVLAALGVPLLELGVLTLFGAVFTAVAVWMAVNNRQRSTLLQIAAVGGLSASTFAAVLALRHDVPVWTWWLWAIVTLHGVASVLSVHARLEARIAAAKPGMEPQGGMRGKAYTATFVQGLAAIPAVMLSGDWRLAVPLLFSAITHAWELYRLNQPEVLRERLQAVGYRMLAVSIAHTLLAIWALWKMATP